MARKTTRGSSRLQMHVDSARTIRIPHIEGEQPLLPWPTYPDGRPLPVGANGQPDFSVLGR